MRSDNRPSNQLRSTVLTPNYLPHAEGSVFIEAGRTRVICTASVEDRVPPFLRNSGRGWVTAEYGMLPRSTESRTDREAAKGRQGGRTHEIQRLIGRSLRAVTDLGGFGERQIKVDCDVIQADGGTRTAAITGSFVALHLAFQHLKKLGVVTKMPLVDHVAAISCGVVAGRAVLDLDYAEDSNADADANFVLTGGGGIIEIQGTAEKAPFSEELFAAMLGLARRGIGELIAEQKRAIAQGT
jgi:ribonuclease PH